MNLNCFKAYDIRGKVPSELNNELAYKIGQAYSKFFSPKKIIIGYDVRETSIELSENLAKGFTDSGVDVIDIGLCGTEEVYFTTSHYGACGGIMITASHNPIEYNGMKMVTKESRPVSGDSGLHAIKDLIAENDFQISDEKGEVTVNHSKDDYINFLLNYVDTKDFDKFKIVVNAGNGCAGPVVDELEKSLPCQFIKVYNQPDGSFPNGIPNPLLPECRTATADAVIKNKADLGIAWDGDFDRCFLFDENGEFIEGYYIVAMLAEAILEKNPKEKIIHDPRLTWNTIDRVKKAGGEPVLSKTGHAYIKERMRKEDAIYGGEMSAHHYFRDFAYCDSGMLPWLLAVYLLSQKKTSLSKMTEEMMKEYPVSGEINRSVSDADKIMKDIEAEYAPNAIDTDHTDGISISFDDWRFNLRKSNTEPLIRLNVETRGDEELMQIKRDELLNKIK